MPHLQGPKLYQIIFPFFYCSLCEIMMKVHIGEIPRPTVWQAIDTLPITIKLSQFAQDASLVQQNFVPYVKSIMILPTPGN